jgi:KaiC/GvpD/RAD55 family RecA-like ATPase
VAEKIATGINGLDVLLQGGIPANHTVLLAGTSGSGKSILSMQFLLAGAEKGEPGLYITFEEDEESVLKVHEEFSWNLRKYLKSDTLRIIRYDPYRFQDIMDIISSNIKQMGAKRLVIDSVSAIGLYIQDVREIRKTLVDIQSLAKSTGCTALIITESPSDNPKRLSRFDVEEFVADGIIVLYYAPVSNEYTRGLFVWKMRGTNHSRKIHPFKITESGITVYPKEEALVKL